MKFSDKDIEAVAKDRVNRVEKQRMLMWMGGAVLAIIVGYFVVVQYTPIGFAICVLGVIGFLYYTNTVSKKQNTLKAKLLKEWKGEQRQVEK